MQAMQISLSGMDVEWRRLEVIANNIANASTTRTALGETFQPQRLLSGPKASFAQYMDRADETRSPDGVTVYGLEPTGAAPRKVYDPTNPQADADGYISYPGLNQAEEMTTLVKTTRAYEANIVALGAARQMYSKALDIGRR